MARKLVLFMVTSLDGYIEGPGHDLSWHNVDNEFNKFAVEQLQQAAVLVFGKHTYQLMEGYWPTAESTDDDAIVKDYMNTLPKIVVSHTLEEVKESENWKNIQLIKNNITDEFGKLKAQEGKDLLVLGSNNLCVTLLELGLLDEIRIMINPVVIGEGTPLFKSVKERQNFQHINTKIFGNGNVLLTYEVQT